MEVNVSELATKKCVPCQGGVPPLGHDEIMPLLNQLSGWEVIEGHHLTRNYDFPDFLTALSFVNKVGGVAEAEGHHPNITLTWGKVGIELFTHKIDGLTESDFILAAKIDELPRE
jgi:4a-hydroxytetrahydrobiopterin dehydratase